MSKTTQEPTGEIMPSVPAGGENSTEYVSLEIIQSKELTPQQYDSLLVLYKTNVVRNFILIGGILSKIKNVFHDIQGFETWKEYLAYHHLSKSFASRSMKVWQYFIEKYQIPLEELITVSERGYYLILPQINEETTKAKAEELLESAKHLSESDLRVTLGHEHDFIPVEAQRCEKCGYLKQNADLLRYV